MSLKQFGPKRRDPDLPAMGNFQVVTHRGARAIGIARQDFVVQQTVALVLTSRDIRQFTFHPQPLSQPGTAEEARHFFQHGVVTGPDQGAVEIRCDRRGCLASGSSTLEPSQAAFHRALVHLSGPSGRERCKLYFNDEPRLQGFERDFMGHDFEQRFWIGLRVRIGDVATAAGANLNHASGGEALHGFSQNGPAYPKLTRQFMLRREHIAGLHRPDLDQIKQALHRNLRECLTFNRSQFQDGSQGPRLLCQIRALPTLGRPKPLSPVYNCQQVKPVDMRSVVS
jgi:hypothetical protein